MKTKIKLDLYLTPYTKINPKLIVDLNRNVNCVKYLEENVGENLRDFGLVKNF